jgi:hypothetical protein
MLQGEVDPGTLLGEAEAAPGGNSELVALHVRHQRKWQAGIVSTQPERPAERTLGIGSEFRTRSHLKGVLCTKPALGQQVTVRSRPGSNHGLTTQVELRGGTPVHSQTEGERQVYSADPGRVTILVEVAVGSGYCSDPETLSKLSHQSNRQSDARIRKL